jgi:DNA-directed RNA polymerase subunit F
MKIFGYRKHLEEEVDYLRSQLAQKQRRIDELQEKLLEIAKPVVKPIQERKPAEKVRPIQPRGWDEVRAHRRANPAPEESDAIQGK